MKSKCVKVTDTYPLPFTYLELHTRFPDAPETVKLVTALENVMIEYVRSLDSKYNTLTPYYKSKDE